MAEVKIPMPSEPLTKRPVDTDFQQQRLRAWQPLLTPKWVIGTFLVIGVLFFVLGGIVISASNGVVETAHVRYDQICDAGTFPCDATVSVNIEADMTSTVYFYYKIENFYQNHRRYVKSLSYPQLKGTSGDVSSCDPLLKGNANQNDSSQGTSLWPCGLIANSKYNDQFKAITHTRGSTITAYDPDPQSTSNTKFWTNTNIAWKSDREDKFKNHTLVAGETNLSPLLKSAAYPAGYPIAIDEELMVWMRTAGLPTFKKLHRIVDSSVSLKAGDKLTITIRNQFPVAAFEGKKYILFSTTSWLGGKNDFLGYAYIVVGGLCVLLGLIFAIKHYVSPRPLGDMKYFNWPGTAKAPA